MNKYIDHTLLKADASEEAILTLCDEAKDYEFKSVCVNPGFVKTCAQALEDSGVLVCTVIGFPLGANTTASKVFEAQDALENGADELDMVLNISALKQGDLAYVTDEIKAIKAVAGEKTLKVIIETCLLTDEEIVAACDCAINAGADFVKTSTGFSTGGATAEDVKLMKETVGDKALVKASGGIRSLEDMETMIAAGASRIGASAGVKIMQGLKSDENY